MLQESQFDWRHKPEEKRSTWRDGFLSITENFIRNLIEPIMENAKEKRDHLMKKFSAIILLSIGGLFFLNGSAIFLSDYFQTGKWLGYIIIGLLLLIIGLIRQRD